MEKESQRGEGAESEEHHLLAVRQESQTEVARLQGCMSEDQARHRFFG